MSMLQEGQAIPRDQWVHWDAESIVQLSAQEVQGFDTYTDTASSFSEITILYNVESDMIV